MSGISDLYFREELIKQCEEHFETFIKEQGDEYNNLTDKDYKVVEEQVDFLFEMMDEVIQTHKNENKEEIDAYSQIIDQLCGYCVLSKMNEARLCNIINELIDRKDDE